MHLIITDLPVPDPPMTTSERPLRHREVDAVQHVLRPEGLADIVEHDMGVLVHRVTPRTEAR